MTTTAQNVTSYVGVSHTVTWTETGVDNSAQTCEFAYRLPDGTDTVIAGTAALSGSDTVYTVTITPAISNSLAPAAMAYQLHVSDVGVTAEGTWRLKDSYAD